MAETKKIKQSGQLPPQDKEIEKCILGALMIDYSCVYLAMSKLFPEVFYVNSHNLIFKAIQNIYDNNGKIDMLTVVDQLRKNDDLENAGGMYYITKLTQDVVSGANIETHISIISEMYIKREAINQCAELMSNAYQDSTDAFDIINEADNNFQKIQERVIGANAKDIKYYSTNVINELYQVQTSGVLGIPTKIKTLDKTICGLVSPDLIILAARPGQGKTAAALSITYNTSVIDDIPCAWFSLEMNGTQLVRRLVSIDTGIDHELIRKGQTTKEENEHITYSAEKISHKNIFIEDKATMNIRDIRTRANLLKKKHGIKYIVVDYLQLMKGIGKTESRESEISSISRGLKEIAKELDIPVIALSQLSREVEKRGDKMPQLSDLRESGAIEQDADIVMFIMRPEYYDMQNSISIGKTEYDPKGLAIFNNAKNRHGKTGNIALQFTGPTMRFSDHWNTTENHF